MAGRFGTILSSLSVAPSYGVRRKADDSGWETWDTTAGSGIAIGNAVTGGGANRVLYEDGSQNLAASPNYIYDGSNLAVGATTAAARIDASIAGGGSGTNIALGVRAGNDGTYYGNNQITFGYNATAEYRHAIKSRHNGGAAANNALDFYVWKQGTDTSTTVGTQRVLTLDGAYGVQAADRFSFVNMPTDYFTGFSDGVGNGFQFNMTNGGQFLPLEYSVAGTNDIFFQLKPATSSGYGYIEAYGSAGLILGTGNNANPVIVRINRTETARFTANGGLSLKFDASNRCDIAIGSTGGVTFDAVGSGAGFTFSDDVTLADAKNLIFNTTTGTKIGTATTQKLGFFNATPIARPASAGAITDSIGGGSAGGTITSVTGADTVDLNKLEDVLSTLALTINDIRSKLVDLGLIS